ncbi:hypothetical protein F7734_08170 [Scytonema sp. UIC 10036]|nr:hypothetical protein [Scytonema sp. UIC 10036]
MALTLQGFESDRYGAVTDESKDDLDVFQTVGTLKTTPDFKLTTVANLRNLRSGEYLFTPGSIYFAYNTDKTKVVITDDSQLPPGLKYEQVDDDKFIVRLGV